MCCKPLSNQIVSEGQFFCLELFQLIKEGVIEFEYHHFVKKKNEWMDEALRASMAAVPVNGRSDTVTYEVTLPKKVGPMPDQDSSSNYS